MSIKNSIILSQINNTYLADSNTLLDFMIDNGYNTLINDYGVGVEYELFEIEENFSHIIKVLKKVGIFVV